VLPGVTISDTCITETHTHPFNGPFSGTTRMSRHQKGKTKLDFTEARESEWQWHHLGHMQVCTSLQTTTPTPITQFFTGRMPFLPPNQQRQSTEGLLHNRKLNTIPVRWFTDCFYCWFRRIFFWETLWQLWLFMKLTVVLWWDLILAVIKGFTLLWIEVLSCSILNILLMSVTHAKLSGKMWLYRLCSALNFI